MAARAQQAWRAQAEAELAAAREREEKAGHAAGHAKGLADAQASYKEKLQQLERMLSGFGEAFAAQVEGLEDIAVAIGFEAAMKIVGNALVTREGVRAVVAQALSRVRSDERLLLRVSPRDFYLLLQQPGDTLMPGPQNVEMVPDDRIELGGCLVETATGTLDARLETQLEALRRLLVDLRQRRG
jgi:flagellar assembly protein FliH